MSVFMCETDANGHILSECVNDCLTAPQHKVNRLLGVKQNVFT